MDLQTRRISTRDFAPAFRALVCLSGAALLSACASHGPPMTATQEAATYIARAKPSYTPPGPPGDPWGPYIIEAANKYDVPEQWIREVMHTESGGHEFAANGVLITSPVGAMGLMQLMPETYDEVRARYNLGDDAFDPHNNILAGTAYLREMYDAFGSPGFLAAYNGGPARLEDYLTHNRSLPAETRRYVAMIAPNIQGIWPAQRSPAEQYAVNQLPMYIPAGPRYVVHHAPVLLARNTRRAREQELRYAAVDRRHHGRGAAPIELAEAPEPRAMRVSYVMPNGHRGYHFVQPAVSTVAVSHHSHAASSHVQVANIKSGHTTSVHVTHTAVVHAAPKAHTHGKTRAT